MTCARRLATLSLRAGLLAAAAAAATVAAQPRDRDDSCAAPAATAERQLHPGHYVAMNKPDTQADMRAALVPGVAGLQKRYRWRTLEPAEGVYDFAEIESDLSLVAERGRQLVVFVHDKSFEPELPTPDYLASYTVANRANGHTALRWKPYVVERFTALLAAIGARFDCHPSFEGVAIQETALGIDDAALARHEYSPEAYRDALIEVLEGAAASMPRSRVFWYMNFLPQAQAYLADVASAVAPAGVAMGGPDVLPDRTSLVRQTYPLYRRFEGQMVLFGSIQFESYAHEHADTKRPTKYWTPAELVSFARDELHVDYLFWNRKTWRKPPDSYSWEDAIGVIAETPSLER